MMIDILAVAGAISLVCGAIFSIYKVVTFIRKPTVNNDSEIKEIKRKQDNDNKRLQKIENIMPLVLKTNMALLDNAINNGNSKEHLREVQEEVNEELQKGILI